MYISNLVPSSEDIWSIYNASKPKDVHRRKKPGIPYESRTNHLHGFLSSIFSRSVGSTGVSLVCIHSWGCASNKVDDVVPNLEHGGKTDGNPDKDSNKEPDGATDGEPLVLQTATYGSEFAAASWVERSASGHHGFYHVRSAANVSDILSKHWGYQQAWPLLRPLLFWKGDTKDLIDLEE